MINRSLRPENGAYIVTFTLLVWRTVKAATPMIRYISMCIRQPTVMHCIRDVRPLSRDICHYKASTPIPLWRLMEWQCPVSLSRPSRRRKRKERGSQRLRFSIGSGQPMIAPDCPG